MSKIVSGATVGLAKVVAYLYAGLGALAVVLGLGLLAKLWTLQEIGGGPIDWVVGPGFLMRLILPFVLATRFAVQNSAVLLLVVGGCHLAGGILFMQGWKIGRLLLVILSGFYIVLQLYMVVNVLISGEHAHVAAPLAFLGLHTFFFGLYMSKAAGEYVK